MLIAKSASETRGKKRSMKRSKTLFRPPTLFQSSSQNRPVDLGQGKELKGAHAGIPSGNPYLEPSSQTDAAWAFWAPAADTHVSTVAASM
jgi:hypothetical protein